jgi:enediyne biosynthesis protein E4
MTGGVAVVDFDGDGLEDLFFTRPDAPNVLYRNTSSGFQDVSAAAGFSSLEPSSGVAVGDLNNDGYDDLVVMGVVTSRNFLYMNDGHGHFTEEAIPRGADITIPPGGLSRKGQGVGLGDYDGDGYLDILTSEHSRPMASNGSRLLHNLGAANPGHFEDVTHAAGLDTYRNPLAVTNPPNIYRFQPQFSDLDRDGRPDIVISSDSHTSQIFWNNGNGTFTDGTVAAGVGTDKSGMGSALGDYNNDGKIDWMVSAIFDTPFINTNPGNRLYRNNGNRTFTDVTTTSGVRNSGAGQELTWGWGTTFFDYDNDTRQDLLLTDGWVALGYGGDHTTLRHNNGDGTFSDVSTAAGITDTGQGRGLVHIDYNNDGNLDAVIANYGDTPIVYRNNGEGSGHWLRVKTEGTRSNSDGIGAFITLVRDTAHPDQIQVREIESGDSYLSASELVAQFGLGDWSQPIGVVEVDWPASGLVQRYVNVQADALLIARERLLGDFNRDGKVDAADYTVWKDQLGMHGDGLDADVAGTNGLPDGSVDELDYLYWKANFGATFTSGPAAAAAQSSARSAPEPAAVGLLLQCIGAAFCRSLFCRGAVRPDLRNGVAL